MNYIISTTYTCGGKAYYGKERTEHYDITANISNDHFSIEIIPHSPLSEFSLTLTITTETNDNTLFYSNSLMSNGIAKEYSMNEKMKKPCNFLSHLAEKQGFYRDEELVEIKDTGNFISYNFCYLRQNNYNDIKLYASLDEKDCYTIFNIKMHKNALLIIRDFTGTTLTAKRKIMDVKLYNDSYSSAFNSYFKDLIPDKHKQTIPIPNYFDTANIYNDIIDEKTILKDIELLRKNHSKYNGILISNGYQINETDWLKVDKHSFPRGIRYLTDSLHESGFSIGLHIHPLLVSQNSFIAKSHPEWLIKQGEKKLLASPFWNGCYALDTTMQEVKDYLKKLFDNLYNDYNFDFIKADSLYINSPYGNHTTAYIANHTAKLLQTFAQKPMITADIPVITAIQYADFLSISEYPISKYARFIRRYTMPECNDYNEAMDSTMNRKYLSDIINLDLQHLKNKML